MSKICLKCGTVLEDDALFCSECGTKQEPMEKKCPNCGGVIIDGAKFCMNCGTPVGGTAQVPAAQPQKQNTTDFEIAQPDESTLSIDIKGISFNMKLIKGGMLGNNEVGDFYFGETVVTQALWQTVMGNNPSEDNSDLQYPVTDFTIAQAKVFLVRLKKITGSSFDIPSGTQFKYAALKGCENMKKSEFDEMRWDDDEYHPVCGMMPNHFGLYDLCDFPQIVRDSVPKNNTYYRFNPIYREGEYDAVLTSMDNVEFEKYNADKDSSTLRLVMNIPVDPEEEKVKSAKEARCAEDADLLFLVRRNDKYGFIVKTGKIVIPCKYEYADDFSEGLARVKINKKYGFIDKTGEEVIPCKYEYADDFSEGLARVEINKKYGFIDKTGKVVIPCNYDDVNNFSEGLAVVRKDGEYGFIDKTGKVVIPWATGFAHDFSDGLAIYDKGEKHVELVFIDKTGKEVFPYKDNAHDFSEGLARVEINKKYGFIDKTSKIVIPCEYEYADDFSEGLAVVRKDGECGFIDKTGKVVIPCKYDDAVGFREGLARVAKNGKFGYIDKTGKVVIPCKYDYDEDDYLEDFGGDFHNGLAHIEVEGETFFIDKTGNTVYVFED